MENLSKSKAILIGVRCKHVNVDVNTCVKNEDNEVENEKAKNVIAGGKNVYIVATIF